MIIGSVLDPPWCNQTDLVQSASPSQHQPKDHHPLSFSLSQPSWCQPEQPCSVSSCVPYPSWCTPPNLVQSAPVYHTHHSVHLPTLFSQLLCTIPIMVYTSQPCSVKLLCTIPVMVYTSQPCSVSSCVPYLSWCTPPNLVQSAPVYHTCHGVHLPTLFSQFLSTIPIMVYTSQPCSASSCLPYQSALTYHTRHSNYKLRDLVQSTPRYHTRTPPTVIINLGTSSNQLQGTTPTTVIIHLGTSSNQLQGTTPTTVIIHLGTSSNQLQGTTATTV